MTKLERAYKTQKRNAKKRDIEFLLTFEEWLNVWTESGHLKERGSKGYVMARHDDIGPYAIGNIEIITTRENIRIGNIAAWGKLTQEQRYKRGWRSGWVNLSSEQRSERSKRGHNRQTAEERSDRQRRGWITRRANKEKE